MSQQFSCQKSYLMDAFKNPRELTSDELALLDRQNEITAFKKNKLELDARKNWEVFYRRNGNRFFKDRHWSKYEFAEIFNDVDLTVSSYLILVFNIRSFSKT
jgi:methyltransferase-like protein 6